MLEACGAFQSTRDYIGASYVVADHWRRAVAEDPGDAAALHLLGRWCLAVADTPTWKRQLARALFADPPRATVEEAAAYFRRAERARPGFWKANLVLLAECEARLGNL